MPLGRPHQVLCVACGLSVSTLYVYPEHCCGFTATTKRPEDDKVVHVCCTSDEGNENCKRGVHHDSFVQLKFEEPAKLRSTVTGETRRA